MNPEELKKLKASLCIEQVVGGYLKLTRVGRCWKGLCPFHGDRHPSLYVNPRKGSFICYACGAKGDVFSFVEKIEPCSFKEAVEKLNDGKLNEDRNSAGNSAPVPALDAGPQKHCPHPACSSAVPRQAREQASSLNASSPNPSSLSLFQSQLLPYASGHSELSGTYLDFEVGRSPVQVPREWYAMRNRVVFPIRNEAGELVAFAARRLNEADAEQPKYINTSTADGYRKSETLYALYRAKEAIRERGSVFLVEGYKDALAMHAAGFTHTVALCGTVLCAGHVALLQQYAPFVWVLLDADPAGHKATQEVIATLQAAGMDAAGLCLPEGDDPDSLFRRAGKTAFCTYIDQAVASSSPSEEQQLLRRIRKGIHLLMGLKEPQERNKMLVLLNNCLTQLTGLSLASQRPATMDWRWI